ncbi:MAG: SpoIID/LytB domain-containing protein [Tepidisphaeraceae bacterium]
MFARRRRHPRHGRKSLRGSTILVGLALGLVGIVAGCLMAPKGSEGLSFPPAGPQVRVLLLNTVPEVTLTVDGQTRRVTPAELSSGAITFHSERGEPVVVNSKRDSKGKELSYRGTVRLVPDGPGIDVVNVLTVEEYLLGVITRESPATWPMDALKSQAIAARTYVIYNVQNGPGSASAFDVFDDTRSQVYGGVLSETPQSRQAVVETSGKVMAYGPAGREKIFQTYFSSTCGGITASAADIFPDDNIPPLRERLADGCESAPRYHWTVTLPKAEFTDRVKAWGKAKNHSIQSMQTIANVRVEASNKLGRPTKYSITDAAGRRYVLLAEQARSALGWDAPKATEVFSGFFTITDLGNDLRLDGQGFGHGVGLCQWCTNGWAKRGLKYDEILKRSYPGAILVRAY